MPKNENKELVIHEDISSKFRAPYWNVEIYPEPRFATEQYEKQNIDQSETRKFSQDNLTKFPCGSCKSEETYLIWLNENLTNAGGTVEYEIKCKDCGVFTFYTEQEFS